MKYIKDIKAILPEISMAFLCTGNEVNRFFLSATKKNKGNLVEEKKTE